MTVTKPLITGITGSQIAGDTIGFDKLINVTGPILMGRVTASPDDMAPLSPAEATSVLDVAVTGTKGLLSVADKAKLDILGTKYSSVIAQYNPPSDSAFHNAGAAITSIPAGIYLMSYSIQMDMFTNGTNGYNQTFLKVSTNGSDDVIENTQKSQYFTSPGIAGNYEQVRLFNHVETITLASTTSLVLKIKVVANNTGSSTINTDGATHGQSYFELVRIGG